MRAIKFRVWDKDVKFMKLLAGDPHNSCMYDDDGAFYYYNLQNGCGSYGEDRSYELMQFTGLHDRIGVEIYEGDIVRCTNDADEVNLLNSDTGIGQVKWSSDGFWEVDELNNWLGNFFDVGYVEVIGNIYENPELLEVANAE